MSGTRDDMQDNDPFIQRIVEPLRTPERVDPTFEARAMSAVHAAAREVGGGRLEAGDENRARTWWTRPRSVRLSPLASLALAAGFAGLVLAGAQVVDSISRGPQAGVVTTRSADTVHVVRFVFVDPAARQVALVGEFNQWKKGTTLLNASAAPGVWTVDLPLTAGRHEYAFVVIDEKGERWVADPMTLTRRDEFGTESSVITVGVNASS
jgi:hypothetical protein